MSSADMNRDESQRCIQLAVKCLEGGNQEKAVRLLEKSIRLCPNITAQNLLAEIQKAKEESAQEPDEASENQENDGPRSSSGTRRRSRSQSGTRQRKRPTHSNASPEFTESRPGSDASKDYTDEQLQAVLRVKKCTTFYQVLFMEKESFSEAILKKQYRKLALILHPDKNKAPGSGEAFKIVGKAYAVLSSAQKKADYDAGGDSYETVRHNPQFARQQGRRRYYRSGNFMFFEDDASADDIFNMFFGQGFNRFTNDDDDDGHRQHVNARRGDPNAQRHTSGFTLFLQLSPLLLFLGLSLLSSLTYTEPVYSLQASSKYPHQYLTRNLDVRFYVKDEAHNKMSNKDMLNIEQNVEEIYLGNLKESCVRERAYKENVMWRGRLYGDHKLVQKGRELETPSCETLSRAYNKLAAA